MSVIQILSASDIADDDQIARTTRSTGGPDGGVVPTRCAGYTHNGAAYCPACAADVTAETPEGDDVPLREYPAFDDDGNPVTDPSGFGVGVVSCTDEWDYPGASCDVCGDRLDTNVLVYDDHGAHPRPVVEVMTGDRPGATVTAYVLEQEEHEVRAIAAESRNTVTAGDVTWLPRESVVRGLEDD